MKLTKEGFDAIMAECIGELINNASKELDGEAVFAMMLTGIHVGNKIKNKIFESDTEIEIIEEGSES